ncbi:MAG: OmpH family outer membrane protein [Candidatus Krumholzibacteriia bacterium]
MSLFLSSAVLTLTTLATNQPAAGTTRVAVVSVGVVSERYLRTEALEARFDQRRTELNRKRDEYQQKIQRLRRSLDEEFKPGTSEFQERRKQLAVTEAELQWFMETEGQRIETDLAGSLRAIFDDIREVVRDVAEEKGIDVVLASDKLPDGSPPGTNQARQQILLQKVLYWSPRVELTEEVVTRLNARYKARQAAKRTGLTPGP